MRASRRRRDVGRGAARSQSDAGESPRGTSRVRARKVGEVQTQTTRRPAPPRRRQQARRPCPRRRRASSPPCRGTDRRRRPAHLEAPVGVDVTEPSNQPLPANFLHRAADPEPRVGGRRRGGRRARRPAAPVRRAAAPEPAGGRTAAAGAGGGITTTAGAAAAGASTFTKPLLMSCLRSA